MRLDRFLSNAGIATRRETAKAVKAREVSVNGKAATSADVQIDPEHDTVRFRNSDVVYRRHTYIMLNKPEGVVSATEDGDITVIDLLPEELRRIGLFPCGRLDKYTVGLIILTNNGPLAHKLLAPKSHAEKTYLFRSEYPLSESNVARLEAGVNIGGYTTQPCRIKMLDAFSGSITLTEGKYHQIKLMLKAVGSSVTFLERVSFGKVALDRKLERGQWRYLTDDEQNLLESESGIS